MMLRMTTMASLGSHGRHDGTAGARQMLRGRGLHAQMRALSTMCCGINLLGSMTTPYHGRSKRSVCMHNFMHARTSNECWQFHFSMHNHAHLHAHFISACTVNFMHAQLRVPISFQHVASAHITCSTCVGVGVCVNVYIPIIHQLSPSLQHGMHNTTQCPCVHDCGQQLRQLSRINSYNTQHK